MSRWSPEEDLSILETIQVLSEELKYTELVEYHNRQFKKTRTELTFKSPVNKIAGLLVSFLALDVVLATLLDVDFC